MMAPGESTIVAVSGHGRRDVKGWVAIEETQRLQTETEGGDRHHRPFLGAWDVVHADRIPDNHIGVLDGAVRLRPFRQSGAPGVLVRIIASGVSLSGMIRRDP